MNIFKRCSTPMPELFKKLRQVGWFLIMAGSAILSSQFQVPKEMIAMAGYITLAGGIISAMCQLTMKIDDESAIVNPKKT